MFKTNLKCKDNFRELLVTLTCKYQITLLEVLKATKLALFKDLRDNILNNQVLSSFKLKWVATYL